MQSILTKNNITNNKKKNITFQEEIVTEKVKEQNQESIKKKRSEALEKAIQKAYCEYQKKTIAEIRERNQATYKQALEKTRIKDKEKRNKERYKQALEKARIKGKEKVNAILKPLGQIATIKFEVLKPVTKYHFISSKPSNKKTIYKNEYKKDTNPSKIRF